MRRAPKTELFKGIYDGIEAEAQRQRRGWETARGEGGAGSKERRDRAKESSWKLIAL